MNDKELVAYAALDYIKNNTIIGLGTGSTADIFINALAEKIRNESLNISVVASSVISQKKANDVGLKYISIDQVNEIDLYIDGADEITKNLEILKGRGFDLVREKLLAQISKKFIVIGDNSKIVSKIGQNHLIPIEITPIAWKITKRLIERIANKCTVRENMEKNAFAITSYGNFVLDCEFSYTSLNELGREVANTPGVFEHGLFLNMAKLALVSDNGQVKKII
ncbi:MAG: ribose 5-phosphate isomerase A [Nitrosomonadales bacterium]|jgi:ribose 5-phosphate isomerase A|nr:ribose 5-phosphate isomerase A [Nitrosomonadales bacterium]MBT4759415.1 ribose 5-phosphate isomerase A [Nitrosomonadales bacterium]MBT5150607.1 ribose 5-phosphate isomerase A [Nitrosomonadales bacterium]MBT5573151.1 ribose 5-phosphate isomerase A [Nitrosomonadales bacterium]MBT6015395.1 ribose 5-phosphate isomerase A [Nitrosomonadales bacterium]